MVRLEKRGSYITCALAAWVDEGSPCTRGGCPVRVLLGGTTVGGLFEEDRCSSHSLLIPKKIHWLARVERRGRGGGGGRERGRERHAENERERDQEKQRETDRRCPPSAIGCDVRPSSRLVYTILLARQRTRSTRKV